MEAPRPDAGDARPRLATNAPTGGASMTKHTVAFAIALGGCAIWRWMEVFPPLQRRGSSAAPGV